MEIKLEYKKPYDFGRMLAFFQGRALEGVEFVDEITYSRAVRVFDENVFPHEGLVKVEDDPENSQLHITISESLEPVAGEIERRIRYMFDVDRDPSDIHSGLEPLKEVAPNVHECVDIASVRVPGCFEPFETACRAILGQQVSVQAANKFAARIVENLGEEIDGGYRIWPTPQQLLALDDIEGTLGSLGVIRNRSRVIGEIARLVDEGELKLGPDWMFESDETAYAPDASMADDRASYAGGADTGSSHAERQMERLLAIKGIGPWTANYIAMRVLGHSDAFLEKDVGVIHAMPDMTPKERLAAVKQCQPYRSYAVLSLWHSIGSAE